MKYFILSACASAILLLGISCLYYSTGSLSFFALSLKYSFDIVDFHFYYEIGIVLVLIGVAFKLGLAPYHVWIYELYKNIPYSSLAYIVGVPKIGIFYFLFNVISILSLSNIDHNFYINIVLFYCLFSLLIAFVALFTLMNIRMILALSGVINTALAVFVLCLSHILGSLFH